MCNISHHRDLHSLDLEFDVWVFGLFDWCNG